MNQRLLSKFIFSLLIVIFPISSYALTQRISVNNDAVEGNLYSEAITMSTNGQYVVFQSSANNLVSGDTNSQQDVFVRDIINNTTVRVSVNSSGDEANNYSEVLSITPNGQYVLFSSYANNLVANDTNGIYDIFVRDILNNTTLRVSVDSSGNEANDQSYPTAISHDGRYVLFYSYASNLVANDTNGQYDVFLRDMLIGTTIRLSVDDMGNEGDYGSYSLGMSFSGQYILFQSSATNLTSGDLNGQPDIFVRDIINNTTIRVSVNSSGDEANNYSEATAISADGNYILFSSYADNLVANDTNGQPDVFVRDIVNNTTVRVSVNSSGDEVNNQSYPTAITPDGKYVLFSSYADNFVLNDTNGSQDVFVRDMINDTTVRVSVNSSGDEANSYSNPIAITPDGKYVLFQSYANNLSPDDINNNDDVFVRDMDNNTTTRVGVDTSGNGANNATYARTITPDGRYVLFSSYADNLVSDDTNGQQDVFVNERQILLGVAPTITSPVDGSYRNTHEIVIEGLANSGADIKVTFLGNDFFTTAGSNNQRNIQLPDQLDATYTVYVQQRTQGSGMWSVTGMSTFIIDTSNPLPPVIISPIQDSLISGGSIYVAGQGEIGGTVTVELGKTYKTATIDGLGNWNVGPFIILPGYKYGIVAKQSDLAGNQSNWSEVRTIYGVAAGTTGINDQDYKTDLVLTKKGLSSLGSDSLINPNEDITYTLDYLNVGNSYATGVTIYETIPTNTCYTVGSISGLDEDYIVEYSNNQGSSYLYVPVGNLREQDCNITNFRVKYIGPYEAKLQAVSDQFDGIKDNVIGSIELSITSSLYTPKLVGPSGYHKFGHGASADFNNDGLIDVIGMGFGSNTTIFTNISTGTNIAFSTVDIGPGFGSYFVGGDVGDINNDGKIDAVGFGYNGFNTLFINTTSGGVISFSSSSFGTHENNTYHHGGDIADFNNDGKLDIIAMGHWGYTKIYTNISTGSNVVFTQTTTAIGGTNGYLVGGAVGDFNNDGWIDAVGGGHNGPTMIFTNASTGSTIVFSTQAYPGNDLGGNPEVGDFNNDGKLDFVRGSTYNNLFINTTVGTGTPTFSVSTIQGGLSQPILHDYDNDGKLDILNQGGYALRILRNISTGLNVVFDMPVIIPEGQTAPHGVVGSDFNGDSKIDILAFAWESTAADYRSVVYQSNIINSGSYTSILYSTGNISGWDKIIMQEDVISGNNSLIYKVYGVDGGNMCDESVVIVSDAESVNGEINLSGYTGNNICVKVDFNIITGGVSPILKSIIGTWNSEDIDSFTFDVRVKAGYFAGTNVTNIAYITSNAVEDNTVNNSDNHIFSGLPLPTNGGGFGGGKGSGGGGSKPPVVVTPPTTPITPTPVIPPKDPVPTGPVTTVEVKPTNPSVAIKEAIVQTSYVPVGTTIEVKTAHNPALETEKKCYTPKEIVDITLGKNTTHKDQLVYQALLKSYDLTIFTDTDKYMPENGLKRMEAAKMFTNFAKHVLCRESVQTYTNNYTDIEDVDATLKPYIIQAYEYRILKGSNNKFRPLERISRKEFVAALIRMFTNTNMDIQNVGNDWDRRYQEAFKAYELDSIVGVDEEIDRYDMSKIMYKLYYNTSYEWTEKGYVLPYGRD